MEAVAWAISNTRGMHKEAGVKIGKNDSKQNLSQNKVTSWIQGN